MNNHALRAVLACASLLAASTAFAQQDCRAIETREPNAPEQKASFPGQTRACEAKSGVAFEVTVMAKGLANPWAVEPLPDGNVLVTEKPGRMRVIGKDGRVGEPLKGLPEVHARGQGGLLDVALSPKFASDRTIYWSYSEPRQDGNGTSVARAVLSKDHTALENVQVILRTQPSYANNMHYGSRLDFGPDGMLYVTMGERSSVETRVRAQDLGTHWGKTLRVTPEGKPAEGNPFIGKQGALPEIWSWGHRNIQAAAFDAQGQYWVIEHGAQGGDELNRVEKGKNYGWPVVAFGEEYSGAPIPNAVTNKEGFEPPVYYWDPVIAPSGAQFYGGSAFAGWKNSLFVGALREKRLVRLQLEGNRVKGEEHLLADRGQRVRDVKQGADGALYVVTDEKNGELWRIAPKR
jgi:glucose/arabinose dehydrogenase